MAIYENILRLTGKTPLIKLKNYAKAFALKAEICAKAELFNPAGSVKDRVALAMIEDAESRGALKAGATVIEPTSGNTGIGLAAVCAVKGYKLIIVMPENMSAERIKLIKAYGAEVVLTPAAEGMRGAVARAGAMAESVENGFVAGQFTNPANAEAHRKTTGPEIWADAEGKIDIFVAGVGTGGTITGAGEYLKARSPAIKIVAVEPAASPVLSAGRAGAHKLQGIGAGFVPEILNTKIYDSIITVTDAEAFAAARAVCKAEGLPVGISSGAALHAATRLALMEENAGKRIVTVLPDSADRYFSTPLFG